MAEEAQDGAIDEPVIDEAARRLAEAAGARSRVILFGSHARDSADVFSEREVEDWREVPNTVIHVALREGRVLRG